MKIMKFCAPGNDAMSQMTCEKLNLMTLALNNDVLSKPNIIADFWKTAMSMVKEGKCFRNIDSETRIRMDIAEKRLTELSAANSKNIAREAGEQRADEAYHLTEDSAT